MRRCLSYDASQPTLMGRLDDTITHTDILTCLRICKPNEARVQYSTVQYSTVHHAGSREFEGMVLGRPTNHCAPGHTRAKHPPTQTLVLQRTAVFFCHSIWCRMSHCSCSSPRLVCTSACIWLGTFLVDDSLQLASLCSHPNVLGPRTVPSLAFASRAGAGTGCGWLPRVSPQSTHTHTRQGASAVATGHWAAFGCLALCRPRCEI